MAEACAFSVPDERLGEVVGAVVQLRDGATLVYDDLRQGLSGHLAKFKIPVHLWCQQAPLKRGTTDKIDRRALRTACLENMEEKI